MQVVQNFDHPTGVSVSPEGLIWICDSNKHRVTIHDEEGKFQFERKAFWATLHNINAIKQFRTFRPVGLRRQNNCCSCSADEDPRVKTFSDLFLLGLNYLMKFDAVYNHCVLSILLIWWLLIVMFMTVKNFVTSCFCKLAVVIDTCKLLQTSLSFVWCWVWWQHGMQLMIELIGVEFKYSEV